MPVPVEENAMSAAALAEELSRFRVVEPARMSDLLSRFRGPDGRALAEYLIGQGALTPFQAGRALAGSARWLVLGPYRLTGEAGAGTFGTVYAAAHRETPGEFRLQMFPLRSLWRARQAKQIARTLTAAAHPAVVPMADADTSNGLHYLVWPHADGISLADRVVTGGPLPVSEAVALLARLADALHACHIGKVAHGTLSPRTIVRAADGTPRLLEHGAGAILAENLAADESLLDTLSESLAAAVVLEFAAPEFVTGPGAPTAAADQYALGAIGYFALTGRSPFLAETRTKQLTAKLTGPPVGLRGANPAVPSDLAAVIDRMLRPNPADRFESLDEVRDRLGRLAVADAGETVRAGSRSAPVLPRSSPRQNDSPPAPDSFAPRPSHARSENPAMAKLVPTDSFADGSATATPRVGPSADPRSGVGNPVRYHTEAAPAPLSGAPGSRPGFAPMPVAPLEPADRPATGSALWKTVKRNFLFWKPPTDVVQVSVFGPTALTPGQSAQLTVYLHGPDASDSVHTLCRAFHHDSQLIGTGYAAREVAREAELAVHLSLSNAGTAKSLMTFSWRGQPRQLVFELHVPWESPAGPAPGVVSVGLDNVRIAKVDFHLHLLPRKG